ncbi:MAG: hypothetical protein M9948_08580 [Lentimicrobium sp.]|nr:hypothetical protein [Lentimicrobium sp.]
MLLGLMPLLLLAQIKETGIPFINQYPKSVYNAGTQNWAITQNSKGFVYFGNNDGLLEFDGQEWQTYQLPVQSIIRSVLAVGDTIYTGSFEQIGYFAPSATGRMEFQSLTPLIPQPYKSFDEIWKIHKTSEGIVFQSFRYIFIYQNNKIRVIKPRTSFLYSFLVDKKLLVVDKEYGLFEVAPSGLKFISNHPTFMREEVRCILALNDDEYLVGTFNNGIFLLRNNTLTPWETTLNKELSDNILYTGIKLSNGFCIWDHSQRNLYHQQQRHCLSAPEQTKRTGEQHCIKPF